MPRCFSRRPYRMEFITRKASSFRFRLTPRITSALADSPVFSNNERTANPSLYTILTADSGIYIRRQEFQQSTRPPGNSGITSTTVNTWFYARLAASIPSSIAHSLQRFFSRKASTDKRNGKIASVARHRQTAFRHVRRDPQCASTLLKIRRRPNCIKTSISSYLSPGPLRIHHADPIFRCSILKSY